MAHKQEITSTFAANYIDLLSERVRGKALSCSDDWFASCENLVKPGRGVYEAGSFVATGQLMDGWESRRSFGRERDLDHDWCILRLGIPGMIRGFDVDTNHFRGNAPEYVSIEATFVESYLGESPDWVEILPKTPVQPHTQHDFDVSSQQHWTHLRLNIFPDGGVARLRAYGEPVVNPDNFIEGELLDLASIINGGRNLDCSNMFFSSPRNLLMPGRGANMGDGWETGRRRDAKHDWCIIKLGLAGTIRKVLVDTAHFKGNFPDRFSLEAVNTDREDITASDIEWQTVITQTKLYACEEHLFIKQIEVAADTEFTHVRLNIYPDGGISRLRVFGFPRWPEDTSRS